MNPATPARPSPDAALPRPADVRAAAERIRGAAHRTPVLTCASLDAMVGAQLFFKCENLQKVGAFKFRGATNAVRSLPADRAARGVATHSSGNHAAALALAAADRGVAAHIVMPRTAPAVKKAAVAGYGARIVWCEPTLAAREETLAAVVAETGAAFVHPYDDPAVIAGQGTATLELRAQVPGLDAVIAPVGGGGLLSGAVLAAEGAIPVYGAEPAGADDAARSLRDGVLHPSVDPDTVADGLLTSLSRRTFAILRGEAGVPGVAAIATVTDDVIVAAMRHLFERAKLVVEPSAAVPLAALLADADGIGRALSGARVGVVLSGGNVDLDRLPWA